MAKPLETIWLVRKWNKEKSDWIMDKWFDCADAQEALEAHMDCFESCRAEITADQYFLVKVRSPEAVLLKKLLEKATTKASETPDAL